MEVYLVNIEGMRGNEKAIEDNVKNQCREYKEKQLLSQQMSMF